MRNPFTPGAGYPPPHLAGREVVLEAFARHLDRSTSIPKHLVLSGLRGTGKTVLLREFQRICNASGWLCVQRELDEAENDTGVMLSAVSADLVRAATAASLAIRLTRAGRRAVNILKPKQIGALGVTYSPAYGSEAPQLFRDQLAELLDRLAPTLTRAHKGLVLLYDEFQEVWDGRRRHQAPLAMFLGAVKQAQLAGLPLVVVACGLPPVIGNIVRSRSYLERDLSAELIGSLLPKEAQAAINRPLEHTDVSFTPELVGKIVEDTRGYPYFLQYYSWFLLDSLPEQRLFDVEMLDSLRPLLLANLDGSFFRGRFIKLPTVERAALVAIAQVGEHARIGDIPWRGQPALLRASVSRLVDRGQLYRPTLRGEVAFSLPLYRDFLLRHGSSI
jgi:hypothetical protein